MKIYVSDVIARFIKDVYVDDKLDKFCFFIDTKEKYIKRFLNDGELVITDKYNIREEKVYYNKLRIKFSILKGLEWCFFRLKEKLIESVNIW